MPEALRHATAALKVLDALGVRKCGLPGVSPLVKAGEAMVPAPPAESGPQSLTYALWAFPM